MPSKHPEVPSKGCLVGRIASPDAEGNRARTQFADIPPSRLAYLTRRYEALRDAATRLPNDAALPSLAYIDRVLADLRSELNDRAAA